MATTYPPPDQVLSALGIEVAWTTATTVAGRTNVDWRLLGRGGAKPGVGALVPIIDLVAGTLATSTVDGDWVATSDVGVYERAPIGESPIELQARVLRAGKRSTLLGVEVSADGRPAASATIEFARIRREATPHSVGASNQSEQWARIGSGSLLDGSLEQACGFRLIDSNGTVEVDRSAFVNNSIGTLQGGVIALLADVSAAAAVGSGARTVELHFRFLDQTKDGPAQARAEILRSDDAGAAVKVEIVDVSTGRLVGWANCRVE